MVIIMKVYNCLVRTCHKEEDESNVGKEENIFSSITHGLFWLVFRKDDN